MRHSLGLSLCVLLGHFSATSLVAEDRFLLLPDAAPALTRELGPEQLIYTDGGVSIVRATVAEVEHLSEVVHEKLGGCGGFLDVTEEISAGQAPEVLVWKQQLIRAEPPRHFSFPVRGRVAIGDLVAKADGNRLWDFLTELSAFPDRSATTDNGGKASQFLKTKGEANAEALPGLHGWTVETGSSSYRKQPSVVITVPGTDPSLPGVVVGAHMDTFSPGKPGADDDGSGTAIVMETLRAVADAKARFKHTVHYIWYSAEERGLVGSHYVVEKFQADNIEVKAALQMDMVGFRSPSDSKDVYFITDNTNADLTEAVRKLTMLYTTASVGETACGYACSDHVNWHQAGVPAVFPFEASFANMNQRLHTANDKIDFLDKEHSLNFARIALAYLGEVAVLEE